LSDRRRFGTLAGTLIAVAFLAGCSQPLTREQIAALDYGPRPQDYEKIVRDYLRPRLAEPDFALIEFKAGPAPLHQTDTLMRGREYGWAVCVMVNDRNPRGAYEGYYPVVVYIRAGRAVASDGGTVERIAGLRYAHAQCKQLGYEVPDRLL
jgi:hypothetical protein